MIYIVGYSRSGTKMMTNVLDAFGVADKVPEIHFFEQLYQFEEHEDQLKGSYQLVDGLITILERDGKKLDNGIAVTDVKNGLYTFIDERKGKDVTALEIYKKFLRLINTRHPVDPTPRNAHYINQIAELIPESKFIYMVRDPRDCILSQSVKWRKYYYNRGRYWEALRLKMNYNPSLMARFWKNSLEELERAYSIGLDGRIFVAKYEDITQNKTKVVKDLMLFLSKKNEEMPDLDFIRSGNVQKWKEKFTKAELYLIESVVGKKLEAFGYEKSSFSFMEKTYGNIKGIFYWMKMPFAFLLNLSRMKNPWKVIKARVLNI